MKLDYNSDAKQESIDQLLDQAADRLLNISIPECIEYNKVAEHLREQRPAIEDLVKAFAKIDAIDPKLLAPPSVEDPAIERVHGAACRLIDMVASDYGLDENEQFHVACTIVMNIASRHYGKVSPTPNAAHSFDACSEWAEKFLNDKTA